MRRSQPILTTQTMCKAWLASRLPPLLRLGRHLLFGSANGWVRTDPRRRPQPPFSVFTRMEASVKARDVRLFEIGLSRHLGLMVMAFSWKQLVGLG